MTQVVLKSWDEVRRVFEDLRKRPLQFSWHRNITTRYVDGKLDVHIHYAYDMEQIRLCFDCVQIAGSLMDVIGLESDEAKDAARYRWLKKHGAHVLAPVAWAYSEACKFGTPDEAIDAAMRVTEQRPIT